MINNNLRVFIRAAERGSFTQAAGELYISQPAVSRAVKALEEELQVSLFFRDKRSGLTLTDAGQKILLLARQMADLENRIRQEAFRTNNLLSGRVRIASLPILTSVFLAKAVCRFQARYPQVSVELLEGGSSEICQAVEEHRADLGFASSPFGHLDSYAVFTDRMVSISRDISPPDTPLDLHSGTAKYIMCRAGYETVSAELKKNAINPDRCLVVQQAESVVSFVKEGSGIGIISELVLSVIPNDLPRRPLNPPIQMEMGIIANDLSDLPPAAAVLLQTLKEVCSEYAQARKTLNTNTPAG